ncbi:MAG: tRNA (adenosine(37)-N6)-threonylcarbamoyltransferase complex ATPase subunit type 1 TsaE [Candidatus Levybacteria bacterium]|nr:tRNA (adenosine(37)-N6)-threonylcarbamoyltransferase complex ATPase subunit type 1 TsaE [Candidatus Levybacteria bacterium]
MKTLKNKVLQTHTAEETRQFAKKLVKELGEYRVVCLYGELGTGKTTFTQGFALGLGVTKRITSPTFILLREYKVKKRSKIHFFYHADFYRLADDKDTQSLGLQDIFENEEAVILIEWADRIRGLLPKKRIDVYFEYIDEKKREITVEEI